MVVLLNSPLPHSSLGLDQPCPIHFKDEKITSLPKSTILSLKRLCTHENVEKL